MLCHLKKEGDTFLTQRECRIIISKAMFWTFEYCNDGAGSTTQVHKFSEPAPES